MIGENIQRLRKEKGYTLSEVAQQASISKSYLSNIERDVNRNPSIHVMKKIASALEVDVEVLLGNNQEIQRLDVEWLDLIKGLKESGIEKHQIQDFKTLIDFIQWQNEKNEDKKNTSS